jgi:predicted ATPase
VAVDEADQDWSEYPWNLPVVAGLRTLGRLEFGPGATFLVGDNGSGKSTLVEAVALAAGLNPEGGSANFSFATRRSESKLGDYLRIARSPGRERTSFFLRAESFYNVATEIERLDEASPYPLLPAYGGVPLHERSHGESFLSLVTHRFGGRGLYLLDEPEAALSPRGALAMVRLMHDLVRNGSQFVVATHSPILLALPGALIFQIDDAGRLRKVDYDDTDTVRVMRGFLTAPERTLRHLLADD